MLAKQSFLRSMIVPTQVRCMSAASIHSRFQAAYEERTANLQRTPKKVPQPSNKAEYGQSYYQKNISNMGSGYVHPYHTSSNPMVFSHYNYMKTLFEAVGHEQVSPHYESLSRSRRGLLFLFAYVGSITSISRMGGWSHNEWLRAMVWHHEYLMAFYLGFIEIRHFSFMLGPKFTVFYNVYTRYETQQLCNQWADVVEEQQMMHLVHTKEQMEYVRINKEYEFVKKRALVNFLTNSRLNLESHMHKRAQTMLDSVERFETVNLKNLLEKISTSAIEKVNSAMADPKAAAAIKEGSFKSALAGIRSGTMTYANDPILPILQEEINARSAELQGLSAEKESEMLSLTANQQRIISDADKQARNEFLSQVPNINNPSIKVHDKFKAFASMVGGHH